MQHVSARSRWLYLAFYALCFIGHQVPARCVHVRTVGFTVFFGSCRAIQGVFLLRFYLVSDARSHPSFSRSKGYGLVVAQVRSYATRGGGGVSVCGVVSYISLELELTQTQMAQKPMLRAEVGMRVRCANKASAE
jgi:hypothetical protein